MNNDQALFEQVALYLGVPWKYNRLNDSTYHRQEIIDGTGRKLIFVKDWKHPRYQLPGHFPHGFWQECKSIGFGAKRPATDIAADIKRRFLSQYLEAFEVAKSCMSNEQAAQRTLDNIAQCLVKVTGGRTDKHSSGSSQRHMYFEHGSAKIYGSSNDITMTFHSLSPETAIKLAVRFCELSVSMSADSELQI